MDILKLLPADILSKVPISVLFIEFALMELKSYSVQWICCTRKSKQFYGYCACLLRQVYPDFIY
jgi:hypothetical protein